MKIVRIVYDWPSPWSGLAPAPYGLTKAQALLGNDITVFCGKWPKAGTVEQIPGVRVYSFYREFVSGFMLLTTAPLMTLGFLLWRLFNRVDVYHVHGQFGLYFYFYKILFGFLDKAPVVAHAHVCFKARTLQMQKDGKRISRFAKYIDWPMSEFAQFLSTKVASAFIFVSENVKNEFLSFYKIDSKKCYVVESGVDSTLFKEPSKEEKTNFRKILNVSESDYLVSNLSFIVERKNTLVLVESLLSLPQEYKLLLVEAGNKEYIMKIKNLITIKNLNNRVIFVKPLSHLEVNRLYMASDMMVLPSSYEGFPKVVLEALSCGLKVIGGGFDFPLKVSGYYEVDNINAVSLSALIYEVSKNMDVVDSASVKEHFSWDNRARKINEIYEKILCK